MVIVIDASHVQHSTIIVFTVAWVYTTVGNGRSAHAKHCTFSKGSVYMIYPVRVHHNHVHVIIYESI